MFAGCKQKMEEGLKTFVLNLTISCYGYLMYTNARFWICGNNAEKAIVLNLTLNSHYL